MSRRKTAGDQEFGSDSFLDIIANIVGILIILIVMAGVKVARQPLPGEISAAAEQVAVESPEPETPAADASLAPPEPIGTDPPADVVAAIAEQSEPSITLDQIEELQRQIETLTISRETSASEIRETESEYKDLTLAVTSQGSDADETTPQSLPAESKRLTDSINELKASITSVRNKEERYRATLSSLSKRQEYVANALEQVTFETQKLKEILQDTESRDKETERINHRLSPVGRSVTDTELHFRLSQGHIAHVPLDGLLERMKDQVLSRRGVIMRFRRYEGVVGPVGGFKMQYTVERSAAPQFDPIRQQSGGYQIAVQRWTILPADTLQAESLDRAVRLGSRFRQILEATEPDSTITIWLYPDDFTQFARLRDLAHSLNLRVAARPLPDGTPIAGSPDGSRSTSQ